jgi:hemerythrin superfamily protein
VPQAQTSKRKVVSTLVPSTSQKPAARRKSATKRTSSDAVVILKSDHRTVEKLFKAFERAGVNALKTKRSLVDQMIRELSVHAFIEEQVLYPAARGLAAAHDDVLEAIEEHHIVKWELQELIGLDPSDEHFVAKVTVLIENVRHHVNEEEDELFPLLRANLPRKRLVELGAELEQARRIAPDHPHPRLPSEPSEHLLPDSVSTVIDRAKEAVKLVRSAS